MFEQANALYHSKNYDSAAKLYTQLAMNGYNSDDLYYNMGNAFYKAQKTGWAVWAYRKSMLIHCTPYARDNYLLAKKQIANPLLIQQEIFFLRWWQSLYKLFSVNVWAIISLLSFVFFLVLFYLQVIQKKRFPLFIKYTFLSIFVTAFFLMFVRYYAEVNYYEAVVITNTTFKPAQSSQTEMIPEGSEVKILSKNPDGKKDKILIKLSDLREGWIAKKSIKRL